MYENESNAKHAMAAQGIGALMPTARRLDITIKENIDEQIAHAEKRLDDLKAIRDRLSASGLMDTRIDDLQQAMRW